MKIDFSDLEKHLEHKINDSELFTLALTHRSVGVKDNAGNKINNERLEFLGDRVLNFTIADLLYKKFPFKSEGFLSKMHALLVKQETLAIVAKRIGLDKLILIGNGEDKSGGREKPTLLSDAMEAVIAALYLDSNFDKAQDFIVQNWLEFANEDSEIQDQKSKLQEMLQKNGDPLPDYEVIDERGPAHLPLFVVKINLHNGRFAMAEGKSKQEAQQNAARKMVKILEQELNLKKG